MPKRPTTCRRLLPCCPSSSGGSQREDAGGRPCRCCHLSAWRLAFLPSACACACACASASGPASRAPYCLGYRLHYLFPFPCQRGLGRAPPMRAVGMEPGMMPARPKRQASQPVGQFDCPRTASDEVLDQRCRLLLSSLSSSSSRRVSEAWAAEHANLHTLWQLSEQARQRYLRRVGDDFATRVTRRREWA